MDRSKINGMIGRVKILKKDGTVEECILRGSDDLVLEVQIERGEKTIIKDIYHSAIAEISPEKL